MRPNRARWACARTAALASTLILTAVSGPLLARPAEEPSPPAPERGAPAVGNWQDFVRLEVKDKELVLTNISDRPIVAWMVRTVVHVDEEHEAWSGTGEDHFRYTLSPDGRDRLFLPGASKTIPRGEEPWTREDLKGPEYRVYYDLGALVFEGAEWVGQPKVADRIFQGRLKEARAALAVLEMTASDMDEPGDLSERYKRLMQSELSVASSREEALKALRQEAWEDYQVAVTNLRPEDVARLELEEVVP